MDQKAYIDQAAEHFRTLLAQQLQRQERMAQGSPAKDFAHMDHIVIGLIPGDGIGPIIMAQARRVLEKLLADEITHGRVELRDIQGLTIENRTAQGKAIPEDVLAAMKACDVLLKGPTETPKGGTLESANVAMRRGFGISVVPAVLTMAGVCGIRIAWIKLVFPQFQTFRSIMLAYPISLVSTALLIFIAVVCYRPSKRFAEVKIED